MLEMMGIVLIGCLLGLVFTDLVDFIEDKINKKYSKDKWDTI